MTNSRTHSASRSTLNRRLRIPTLIASLLLAACSSLPSAQQLQVQQMQQSPQGRQINETIRATGHASTYMNYSHFYPQR